MKFNTKSLTISIIFIGIVLFLAVNHWMSQEVSKPIEQTPVAPRTSLESVAPVKTPINNPALPAPVQTKPKAQAKKQTVKAPPAPVHDEPSYDPPTSAGTILVQ